MPRPKGLKQTPEARQRISEKLKGRRLSEDHKANQGEGARRMWQRRRQK